MSAVHKPITAKHLRAANDSSGTPLPELHMLFARLIPSLQTCLESLTNSPFRLSFDGLTETRESYPLAEGDSVCLQSTLGTLDAWTNCDRGFVVALADLCFGGTGKEPPADGEDRPFSHIETCLRQAVYDDLKTGLMNALSSTLAVEFQLAPSEEPGVIPAPITKVAVVAARYLLNGFGYSGDMRIAARKEGLIELFRKRDAAQPGKIKPTLASEIGATEVDVKLALPPQYFTVSQLNRLRTGQTLLLEARPRGPIHILAEGQELFTAQLTFAAGGLGCIVGDRPGAFAKSSTASPPPPSTHPSQT